MNFCKFFLFALISLTLTAHAEWHQFMGKDHAGFSTPFKVSKDHQAVKVWEKAIGIGFSSMSANHACVFTMGHVDGEEIIWALDRATGEVSWKKSYPAKLLPNLHEGGPAATPTLFGEKLFTLGKDGRGYCLKQQDGAERWQIDVNKAFGLKTPEWGYSSSALVHGDHLVLDVGPTVCLKADTGKLVWKTKNYKAGYGSPAYMEIDGQGYYAVLNNEGLVLLRVADGSVAAFHEWKTSYETNSTTPMYCGDGKIFISTAYNRGCTLLQVEEGAFKVIYENKEMRNHMNNCVPVGSNLVGFDRKAHNRRLVKLRCMDRDTGEIKWSEEGLGCGSVIQTTGGLLVLSDQGEMILADFDDTGFKPFNRTQILDGKCWTHPILVDGMVYARNAKGRMVCYDLNP